MKPASHPLTQRKYLSVLYKPFLKISRAIGNFVSNLSVALYETPGTSMHKRETFSAGALNKPLAPLLPCLRRVC